MANLLIEWEKRTQFLDSWIMASSFSKNRQGRSLLGGLRGWRSFIALTGKWYPCKRRIMIINIKHLWNLHLSFGSSLKISSVQSLNRVWLCNPMDCSTPGFPGHHQLLELAQTHVHRVSDAIQPSHPLSSLSPPAFNLSKHQGLFQWVSSSHQVPKYRSFSFSISHSNE